jgi:tRNA(His) guanylyltransferase
VSTFASCFTSAYVRGWPAVFGADTPLKAAPIFDARAVAYPDPQTLRDYIAWRQADCHVNNQYNTPYWALVQSGASRAAAQAALAGTDAAFKNELLFSKFGINYNALPARFRKGTVLARARRRVEVKPAGPNGSPPSVERERSFIDTLHEDVIGAAFWDARPELLV